MLTSRCSLRSDINCYISDINCSKMMSCTLRPLAYLLSETSGPICLLSLSMFCNIFIVFFFVERIINFLHSLSHSLFCHCLCLMYGSVKALTLTLKMHHIFGTKIMYLQYYHMEREGLGLGPRLDNFTSVKVEVKWLNLFNEWVVLLFYYLGLWYKCHKCRGPAQWSK